MDPDIGAGRGPGGPQDDPLQAEASEWALQYAQKQLPPFDPAPPGKVRIRLLTDPWSVWCWGFEPVRRTLELRYPSIVFEPWVGGMFAELPGPDQLGFDLSRFFGSVYRATGMPVSTEAVIEHRPDSTYPACIHAHAARLLEPGKESAYLRQLREAVYLDGLNINDPVIAARLAHRAGLDSEELMEALASPEPQREFQERMEVLKHHDLSGYPTLLFSWGERTTAVGGFQDLNTVLNLTEQITDQVHASMPPPELLDLFETGERLATREVAQVMGLSLEAAYDLLADEARKGRLAHQRHPLADTWSTTQDLV